MRLLPSVGCEWGTNWVIKELIQSNLEPVDIESEFEQMMRECYPEETQVGFMTVDTVQAMKDCDPVGWRCAVSEYESNEESERNIISFDHGSTYYRVSDVEELIEDNS